MIIQFYDGSMYKFEESSRLSVAEEIEEQSAVRDLRDDESVMDSLRRYGVLLPTYVYAEYLTLCHEIEVQR